MALNNLDQQIDPQICASLECRVISWRWRPNLSNPACGCLPRNWYVRHRAWSQDLGEFFVTLKLSGIWREPFPIAFNNVAVICRICCGGCAMVTSFRVWDHVRTRSVRRNNSGRRAMSTNKKTELEEVARVTRWHRIQHQRKSIFRASPTRSRPSTSSSSRTRSATATTAKFHCRLRSRPRGKRLRAGLKDLAAAIREMRGVVASADTQRLTEKRGIARKRETLVKFSTRCNLKCG